MKKLKILHVITSLGKGGAERLLIDICHELKKKENIEYKIICLSPVNEYLNISSDLNIIYCNARVKLSLFRKTENNITEYLDIVNEFKPDIIHSHLFTAEIISREITCDEIVYVTHLHGYENQFEKFSFITFFLKRKITNLYEKHHLIKKYFNSNNYFIAISKYVNEKFGVLMPSRLKKIFLLPNAIDFKRFNKNINCKHFSLCEPIRLLSAGSFVKKKNHIFLIEVMDILVKRGYDIILDIIGEGQERPVIEKKITEKKLQKNITLHGSVSDIENYYHNAFIYVHSAIYEPFGLVILEAMAAGLPVICLDGKGNRDIINDGYNGFMIYENNAEIFADKIIQLISNSELYNKISENAVKYASEYDIEKYTENLVKFYNLILSEKKTIQPSRYCNH